MDAITDIKAAIANLSPKDVLALKEALGVRKARPKKEESPEYIAAKSALDGVVAEDPTYIQRYEDAREALRAIKGTRKVLANKSYVLDKESGIVTAKDTGEVVTTHGNDGWQSAMRSQGFTNGQIAAVAKAMRHLAPVAA